MAQVARRSDLDIARQARLVPMPEIAAKMGIGAPRPATSLTSRTRGNILGLS